MYSFVSRMRCSAKLLRSGAPLIRDRSRQHFGRSRVCSAPLRAALRPGHVGHTLMYDAIIIGAGHNGLVAAIHLAGKGWKVAVVEAANEPGGSVKTREVTLPGFRHDLFATNLSLFAGSPFFAAYKDKLFAHGLGLRLGGGLLCQRVRRRHVARREQGCRGDGRAYRARLSRATPSAGAACWPSSPAMRRICLRCSACRCPRGRPRASSGTCAAPRALPGSAICCACCSRPRASFSTRISRARSSRP